MNRVRQMSQGPLVHTTLPSAVAEVSGDVVTPACTRAASSNASAARRWGSEGAVGAVGRGPGAGPDPSGAGARWSIRRSPAGLHRMQ